MQAQIVNHSNGGTIDSVCSALLDPSSSDSREIRLLCAGTFNILCGVPGAAFEMKSVSSQNMRTRYALFHCAITWDGPVPSEDEVRAAAYEVLQETELDESQCLYALHSDGETMRLHISVNRMDLITFRPVPNTLAWTKNALQKAASRIERDGILTAYTLEESQEADIGEEISSIADGDIASTSEPISRQRTETSDDNSDAILKYIISSTEQTPRAEDIAIDETPESADATPDEGSHKLSDDVQNSAQSDGSIEQSDTGAAREPLHEATDETHISETLEQADDDTREEDVDVAQEQEASDNDETHDEHVTAPEMTTQSEEALELSDTNDTQEPSRTTADEPDERNETPREMTKPSKETHELSDTDSDTAQETALVSENEASEETLERPDTVTDTSDTDAAQDPALTTSDEAQEQAIETHVQGHEQAEQDSIKNTDTPSSYKDQLDALIKKRAEYADKYAESMMEEEASARREARETERRGHVKRLEAAQKALEEHLAKGDGVTKKELLSNWMPLFGGSATEKRETFARRTEDLEFEIQKIERAIKSCDRWIKEPFGMFDEASRLKNQLKTRGLDEYDKTSPEEAAERVALETILDADASLAVKVDPLAEPEAFEQQRKKVVRLFEIEQGRGHSDSEILELHPAARRFIEQLEAHIAKVRSNDR